MKNKVLKKENKLYEEQVKNTKKYIETIRRFNHDLEYHLIHIKNLISKNNYTNANKYIEQIFEVQKNNEKIFINTGNYIIDNIVNFKLSETFKKNININVSANVPYDINISEFHIVCILGNLIQNAIEANEKVEENRFINLDINYKLNKLFIIISNRFDKNIKIKNNKLLTTKINADEHGIGMLSIYNSIKQFNGELIYKYDKDIFTVEILLFL
nr:GHKL domain-containing protein [uncultured Tyzzerella sp.]